MKLWNTACLIYFRGRYAALEPISRQFCGAWVAWVSGTPGCVGQTESPGSDAEPILDHWSVFWVNQSTRHATPGGTLPKVHSEHSDMASAMKRPPAMKRKRVARMEARAARASGFQEKSNGPTSTVLV